MPVQRIGSAKAKAAAKGTKPAKADKAGGKGKGTPKNGKGSQRADKPDSGPAGPAVQSGTLEAAAANGAKEPAAAAEVAGTLPGAATDPAPARPGSAEPATTPAPAAGTPAPTPAAVASAAGQPAAARSTLPDAVVWDSVMAQRAKVRQYERDEAMTKTRHKAAKDLLDEANRELGRLLDEAQGGQPGLPFPTADKPADKPKADKPAELAQQPAAPPAPARGPLVVARPVPGMVYDVQLIRQAIGGEDAKATKRVRVEMVEPGKDGEASCRVITDPTGKTRPGELYPMPVEDLRWLAVTDDPDAWRAVGVAALGLPEKLALTLIEKGMRTLGDLAKLTADGYGRLTDLPGVGEAKATKIEDAMLAFFRDQRIGAMLPPATPAAAAVPADTIPPPHPENPAWLAYRRATCALIELSDKPEIGAAATTMAKVPGLREPAVEALARAGVVRFRDLWRRDTGPFGIAGLLPADAYLLVEQSTAAIESDPTVQALRAEQQRRREAAADAAEAVAELVYPVGTEAAGGLSVAEVPPGGVAVIGAVGDDDATTGESADGIDGVAE